MGGLRTMSEDEEIARLYGRLRPELLRLAVALVDDRGTAEEIVHDAFLGLQRRRHAIRESAAVPSYLRRSVLNGARSELRRRRVRRAIRLETSPVSPPADVGVLLAEDHAAVLRAVRRLPPRQRQVTIMRYWADMSESDIATTLGISRGGVKSSASRAIAAIERALMKELTDDK